MTLLHYLFAITFGLIAGSFITMLSYRIVKHLDDDTNIFLQGISGRSKCPVCSNDIKPINLIPVFSWLRSLGKCAECKTPISVRYPIIELTAATLSVLALWTTGVHNQDIFQLTTGNIVLPQWMLSPAYWLSFTFLMALLTITITDLENLLIPDRLSLPMLWLGILAAALVPDWYIDLKSAVLGAVLGYVSLWTLYQIHHAITKREGMGYGDFKLTAAICAWIGISSFGSLLIIAGALAVTIMVIRLIAFSKESTILDRVPFGPYLAAGGATIWLYSVYTFSN
jgi:leader peptidase (prepilin peptidase)/N-methyltransferase